MRFFGLTLKIVLCTTLMVIDGYLAGDLVNEQPPFPALISARIINRQLHIVSESVSQDTGYLTTQEHIDLDAGKLALSQSDTNGIIKHTYVDAQSDVIFQYWPYQCVKLKPDNLLPTNTANSSWRASVKVKSTDSTSKEDKILYLTGVAALWLNVAPEEKKYSAVERVFSGSEDIDVKAHKWTITDRHTNDIIHFYFVETRSEVTPLDQQLTLVLIKIESAETNEILMTINILAVEYFIPEEIEGILFQVPVGYGCGSSDYTKRRLAEIKEDYSIYFWNGALENDHFNLEVEISATKFEQTDGASKRHTVSTVGLQLAQLGVSHKIGLHEMQLVRQREICKDLKTILDYMYGVRYEIDGRRGTCEISKLNVQKEADEGQLALAFKNGLSINMNLANINEMFVNREGFEYTKLTGLKWEESTRIYMEKTSESLIPGKLSRIMRVSRLVKSPEEENHRDELESVTIWVFNEEYTQIVESYHINILDYWLIDSWVKKAKLFDISEECYLNNEKMVEGRDYAWVNIEYPVASHFNKLLMQNVEELKEEFYLDLYGHLDFFHDPRMEIMFDEEGFTVRLLMLDQPSLALVFDVMNTTTQIIAENSGELEDIAVDTDHCADLCRLNRCRTMTYCQSDHSCLLSPTRLNRNQSGLVLKESCKTYFLPEKEDHRDIFRYYELSLNRRLSNLRHIHVENSTIPQPPEELMFPASVTGIDSKIYNSMVVKYISQLREAKVKEPEERVVSLFTINVYMDNTFIVLPPSKFEIEQDPLDEFSLTARDSSDFGEGQNKKAAFHRGLTMHRYKIHTSDLSLIQGETINRQLQDFNGVSYDQCEIACIDGKCSSFSYCPSRYECILSNIYDLSSPDAKLLIQLDSECFIAQHDFLSKFSPFTGVPTPDVYKRVFQAQNPTECAHTCIMEDTFNCLAFDYCPSADSRSNCFYQDTRLLYTGAKDPKQVKQKAGRLVEREENCVHYSRSYLADFVRLEYHSIAEEELYKMSTASFNGKSVDRCAEICANEMPNCSAFQMCVSAVKKGVMQNCTLIGSQPKEEVSSKVDKDLNRRNILTTSSECHVFTLRKDSGEARNRQLAFNNLSVPRSETKDTLETSGNGVSLGRTFLVYIFSTIFVAVVITIYKSRDENGILRKKIERARVMYSRS